MLRIGVIGYGYWGPNVVRNFNMANESQVTMVCDMNSQTLKKVKKVYPYIRVTPDCATMIKDPEVDAVAIATPVFTLHALDKMVLQEGKSVFV